MIGMPPIPSLDETTLRAVCNVLGDTNEGLSGSETGQLLGACGINDLFPGNTKRDRLFDALQRQQQNDGCANQVVAFIQNSMNPVRYTRDHASFEDRRLQLNQVLAFAGFSVGEDGKLSRITQAQTLSEAQERAGKLYRELMARRAHSDVIRFCRAELLQDNYFHAVFEATKSVADKIREKSGLSSDDASLVDEAFGSNLPLLALNTLRTETEWSEQKGFMNLLKGLFGTFRNTTAHAPKVKWVINEQDALDMLSFTSLLHRRLDNAVKTRPTR
jgi:uncharacterized protein (TIGR02391 family)